MTTLDLQLLPASFAEMKDLIKDARKGALSGALAGVPLIQRATMQAGAVNTGAFMRGWRASSHKLGAMIYNKAMHAAFIEEGRKPGKMPPSSALANWAGKRLKVRKKQRAAIGFLIARAIARRGIKGKHIRERAKPALVRLVKSEIQREVLAGIQKRLFKAKSSGRRTR